MEKEICLSKEEYNDILDFIERLQETVEVLSNKESVEKINNAISRIESGEFLTKEEMISECTD